MVGYLQGDQRLLLATIASVVRYSTLRDSLAQRVVDEVLALSADHIHQHIESAQLQIVAELLAELLPGLNGQALLSHLEFTDDVEINVGGLHVKRGTLLDANLVATREIKPARHPRVAAGKIELERELVDKEAVCCTAEAIVELLLAVGVDGLQEAMVVGCGIHVRRINELLQHFKLLHNLEELMRHSLQHRQIFKLPWLARVRHVRNVGYS